MSKLLVGSIDLNKIDKSKIVTKDKNGNAFSNGAKYLNVVVWVNDQNDQYGNIASIQESTSKEERDKGVKANYIGNLKDLKQQSTPLDNMPAKNDLSTDAVSEEEDSEFPF